MKPKESIKEKRLSALYNYANTLNRTQSKNLLAVLLAMISHRQVKDICENLDIKI